MTMQDKVRAVQDSPALPDLCRAGSNISSSRAFGHSVRGLDEEWPAEQNHNQQQDGGTVNGCEKGGRILLRQAIRGGDGGQNGTSALGPSSIQPWFRQQGPGSTSRFGRGNRGI